MRHFEKITAGQRVEHVVQPFSFVSSFFARLIHEMLVSLIGESFLLSLHGVAIVQSLDHGVGHRLNGLGEIRAPQGCYSTAKETSSTGTTGPVTQPSVFTRAMLLTEPESHTEPVGQV